MAKLMLKLVEVESKLLWLYVKKVNHEIEVIKVDESDSSQNPLNIFPYLNDGEIEVWGVQPILSYFTEKYGYTNLYNSEMKVKLNTVLSWISLTLYRYVLLSYVFPQSKEEFKLESSNNLLIAYGLQKTHEQLHLIEEIYFASGNSMFESQVTICDYYLALVLMELDQYNFDFSKYPKMNIWMQKYITEIKSL